MLNICQFIGNITNDIELKQTPNWTSVINFDIAVNKKYTGRDWVQQEKVEFISFVAFKQRAEIIHQYAKKGDKIYLAGEFQTRSWEVQDWTKRYKSEILVEKVELLGTPKWEKTESREYSEPTQRKATPRKDEEISIEDIPF